MIENFSLNVLFLSLDSKKERERRKEKERKVERGEIR
jgi:hypothetical protein